MPIKVYIVSLARATERRKFMEKQLEKLNLDYQFIEAHDARNITNSELQEVNNNRIYEQDLSRGEVACAISHSKACKTLANDQVYDYGLIIEDDIILGSNLPLILNELQMKGEPEDITLLYTCIFKPVVFSKHQDLALSYGLVTVSNTNRIYGAQAYFISKEKAASFADKITPVKTIADDWAHYTSSGYFTGLKVVYPFPVIHAEFLSVVNEKQDKSSNIRGWVKDFIYHHRVYPLYQLFLKARQIRAEKIQRKNISAPDFLCEKTYKL